MNSPLSHNSMKSEDRKSTNLTELETQIKQLKKEK